MGGRQGLASRRYRAAGAWCAAAVIALTAAGCGGHGVSKAGGAPEAAPDGTITLTFASAQPLPVDTSFAALVAKDSGGHLRLRTIYYNARSTSVDVTVALALQAGKLDVGDVGSRAWESLGIGAFRAYQAPFLVTSRELLDQAVTRPVASGVLATLQLAKLTGLAIVPDSIRYLFSTRPLTTPAQFFGAKIRVNVSETTKEAVESLGAVPVTDIASGPAAIQALRDGQLTAIEADPELAMGEYVHVAPYVLVNAPLFAKTTTLAASSAVLAKLPAADAGWLQEAARQAAAGQANAAADRMDWASMCGAGLKPLAVTPSQFDALHNAETPTYADLSSDPQTTLAIDRIGEMAASDPRMDSWATCHGVGVAAASPTKVLDGRYGFTYTQAEVVATGDCTDCGNAGTYTLTIHDGRYAIFHPVQLHNNPAEPSVSFFRAWRPSDPVEVGTISIHGNRATLVPEVNQQNGSATVVFTFELFRGSLTWHLVSSSSGAGAGWEQDGPWKQLS
jgi:TRAP-type C4-dicarboxylate transport system substrate-binding protein